MMPGEACLSIKTNRGTSYGDHILKCFDLVKKKQYFDIYAERVNLDTDEYPRF